MKHQIQSYLQVENTFYQEWKVQRAELLGKIFEKVLIIDAKVTYGLNEAPGPGNYRLPSDFGYYIDKTAFKCMI